MIVKYNDKTQKITFKLEEKDFYDALQIEELMNGVCKCRHCGKDFQSNGWKVLTGYFKSARELLIEAGKDGTRTRAKRELSDLKFAKIDGFDYAVDLPSRIVRQAHDAKEAVNKVEGVQNAGNDY